MNGMKLTVTRRQLDFIRADAPEVLFGGAAGGGKSYGQLIDALLYALAWPGSRQLILRRTYPELDISLIRVSRALYPKELFSYSGTSHCGVFRNGSVIDFGYCAADSDVYRYQSSEYDTIRFDELTHFPESAYLYLMSRLRGANDRPKQMKSTTNPGGPGHSWVKARFVDPAPPDTVFSTPGGGRLYLPARVYDNCFLMKKDAGYIARLENLGETDRRALLHGDWDIFEGQYFDEFSRDIHVVQPFEIPPAWRRYRALDYGLDCLACYWVAVDGAGRAWVYREVYESNLLASQAAERIRALSPERVHATFAPPDLYSRHKDTGRSTAEIFEAHGVPLTRVSSDRVQGWYDLKEWLHPLPDGQGGRTPGLRIFGSCINLLRTLPAIARDSRDPNDAAPTPHELTHAPDALRYFAAGRPCPASDRAGAKHFTFKSERPAPDPLGRGERMRIV